jgi:hypothetical protein
MSIVRRLAACFASLALAMIVPTLAPANTVLTNWGSGSLGFIADGASNTIQFTESTSLAVCVDHVSFNVPIGSIADGTSNTLAFTVANPWSLQAGIVRPRQPIGTILDGTSNTILIGETPSDALCFGDAQVIPPITDGTSNTIMFGETSTFDMCLNSVRIGTIADGTSNTIVFGETTTSPVCFSDVQITPESNVVASEPGALAVVGLALAGAGAVRLLRTRRRCRAYAVRVPA